MLIHELSDDDRQAIARIADRLLGDAMSTSDPDLLEAISLASADLPRATRECLLKFRLHEPAALLLVRGLQVDDAELGPTPGHWRDRDPGLPLTREELSLLLLSSLLGDAFGWSTQQDGRIIHNVVPVRAHEYEQLGSGSREVLWWHTEDAFHDLHPDYVALLCLRNPDDVATTAADIRDVRIADEHARLLHDEQFTIVPDNSHQPKHSERVSVEDDMLVQAREAIENMASRPRPRAIFFGSEADPYVRVDPFFMPRPSSEEHARALDELRREIDGAIREVILRPGDCLMIDNFRAVHGRASFVARFDGTDRWLKRACIARDLRRSRSLRLTARDRVLYG